MNNNIAAFDDFVDECFVGNDSLCKYEYQELDLALERLLIREDGERESRVR